MKDGFEAGLRILSDMKGSKLAQTQTAITADAELGLHLAEEEIYRDIDQKVFAI